MGIKVSNLTFSVKEGDSTRTVLDNLSYEFKENKITTISGPSGSGKTTFLYSLAGILNIDSGEVEINNTLLYSLPSSERDKFRLENIGLVYQNLNLIPFMSVEDNILLPLFLQKKNIGSNILKKMKYYLELLDLPNIETKSINNLSGGEKQRVAIIRSVIAFPKIILCDEPTASLDSSNTIKFMEAVNKINRTQNITIVIVTHDKKVFDYGDEKLEIIDGKFFNLKK